MKPLNAREALARRYRRFRALLTELHMKKLSGRPVSEYTVLALRDQCDDIRRELRSPVIESRRTTTSMHRRVRGVTEKMTCIPEGGMR